MLSEQIAHRVIVDIESGCWEWQGSKDPKSYYTLKGAMIALARQVGEGR